ncbi:hypothetical protein PCANC_00175 [Puccinia coronata f. sp. avenae]|uniref:Uncharacterized protein n=1 Tax=Puccinia coronata f. sp. avenae TaxID=200324 RepID=A0A2N5W8T6_9BASI|nr:hypothetical protein PCANC_00175 [Puccinia coronata f. sp. avenae]
MCLVADGSGLVNDQEPSLPVARDVADAAAASPLTPVGQLVASSYILVLLTIFTPGVIESIDRRLYTAGRFRKFGIHPLGVPATQGSHDQFWRPRDRTKVSVIPTTPLRQGRGVAAGPIGSPKRSLRPGNSTILFMTNFVRHNRLT